MQQVLGIVASQRRMGNCEIMVREISRQLTRPHQLTLLRLPEFSLRYCKGCYRCLHGEDGCAIDDDLADILDALEAADALILAAPTYFLGGHACLKMFVDRGISFYPRGERLWGKPAVGVGVSGIPGKEGSTLLDIERFLLTIQADNRLSRIVYGALPGEVMLDDENSKAAGALAAALSGVPAPKTRPCCPLCGGTTIRFLDDSRVRCMLCSNTGELVDGPDGKALDIRPSEYEFVADRQAARHHDDWLRQMQEQYLIKKEQLRKVRNAYLNEAPWVKPFGPKGNA